MIAKVINQVWLIVHRRKFKVNLLDWRFRRRKLGNSIILFTQSTWFISSKLQFCFRIISYFQNCCSQYVKLIVASQMKFNQRRMIFWIEFLDIGTLSRVKVLLACASKYLTSIRMVGFSGIFFGTHRISNSVFK